MIHALIATEKYGLAHESDAFYSGTIDFSTVYFDPEKKISPSNTLLTDYTNFYHYFSTTFLPDSNANISCIANLKFFLELSAADFHFVSRCVYLSYNTLRVYSLILCTDSYISHLIDAYCVRPSLFA